MPLFTSVEGLAEEFRGVSQFLRVDAGDVPPRRVESRQMTTCLAQAMMKAAQRVSGQNRGIAVAQRYRLGVSRGLPQGSPRPIGAITGKGGKTLRLDCGQRLFIGGRPHHEQPAA